MTADPLVLSAEVDRATVRLLDTVRTLDGAGLAEPSLLGNWTRGHIVTHLARNAEAHLNLLSWARTGVETPAYAGPETRAADIEAGSGRPHEVQLSDLVDATQRLAKAFDEMPAEAWSAQVKLGSAGMGPAARLVWSRLCEVELHHVDLAAGYGPADWTSGFALRLLHDPATPHVATLVDDDGTVLLEIPGAPVVTGPVHLLAAWLSGRSNGVGLTGDLPSPKAWK